MITKEKKGTQLSISVDEDVSPAIELWHTLLRMPERFLELWDYHDLVRNLVARDLKVRYRNSVLGILWSLMNPLLMVIVFTIVFTVMAPVRSASTESFPVFVLCGLLPWNFFSSSVMAATVSIVGNSALIKKVYFPLEVLPLSVILGNLVNFLISFILLFAVGIVFQTPLTIWLLYLPVIILIQIIFMLGMGFFLGAINVFYRDTLQIIDVLMLAWFFVTPIFYPLDILPRNYEVLGVTLDIWKLVYFLNPMASLVANYRIIIYYGSPPALDFLFRTAVTATVVFVIGWLFFNHFRWRYAEEL